MHIKIETLSSPHKVCSFLLSVNLLYHPRSNCWYVIYLQKLFFLTQFHIHRFMYFLCPAFSIQQELLEFDTCCSFACISSLFPLNTEQYSILWIWHSLLIFLLVDLCIVSNFCLLWWKLMFYYLKNFWAVCQGGYALPSLSSVWKIVPHLLLCLIFSIFWISSIERAYGRILLWF